MNSNSLIPRYDRFPKLRYKKLTPLAPDRRPEEGTIEIAEGQRGISYEKLFLPYLKGAKAIKICDPYVRLQYQIYNLMSFCEILEPTEGVLRLELVTGSDSYQEAEQKEKLDRLKEGLQQDQIQLDYSMDDSLHDRWIEIDTGWHVVLGRGLDIFQKPEDKFTLGFLDQTKRSCKATRIVYTRTS